MQYCLPIHDRANVHCKNNSPNVKRWMWVYMNPILTPHNIIVIIVQLKRNVNSYWPLLYLCCLMCLQDHICVLRLTSSLSTDRMAYLHQAGGLSFRLTSGLYFRYLLLMLILSSDSTRLMAPWNYDTTQQGNTCCCTQYDYTLEWPTHHVMLAHIHVHLPYTK